jgi:S1-C subfamily serine protease
MHIQQFDCQKHKVRRRIAAALLSGTMLAIPHSAVSAAQQAIAMPATAVQQHTGFAEIIAKAQPTVVSIMVAKSTKSKSGDTFSKGPNGSNMEHSKEFFERFDIPQDNS